MQSLTGDPRDEFTEAQITDLLLGAALEVDNGLELLDVDLNLIEDISDSLVGGSISWSLDAGIHRTCDLELTTALQWGAQLVRPFMSLSNGIITARWNLGVYMLTTPATRYGSAPRTYSVQGYDRLVLLNREVGADYTVTAGTTYRQALLDAFSAAGLAGVYIEGSAADNTLPADKSWPLVAKDESDQDQTDTPATWLRVVNDLLQAINFRSVWCNEDGAYQCIAYKPPTERAPEWTFDANDEHFSIVSENREEIKDVWKTPNKWVFRWKNGGAGVEGNGVYTVDESDAVNGDSLGRTLEWVSVVDYEAASQAKLEELGNRHVATDKRTVTTYELQTGTFPPAGHADIYTYTDADGVGASMKVQAVRWKLPLDGGDIEWTWETVT